nr:F-box/kelch-repeat protein At3g06240-like [Nicotiana tomentosiformis]
MKNLILAFDLSDEIFVELQLPECLVIGLPMNLNTAEFGESLAIYHYDKCAWTWICSIWVMKEYGVVESWSKEYNIVLDWEPGMILGFRNNSEILLTRRTGQLVSYNLETHEKMNFDIIGTKNSFFMGTYEESLVLLNEGQLLLPNDFSSEADRDEC